MKIGDTEDPIFDGRNFVLGKNALEESDDPAQGSLGEPLMSNEGNIDDN